MNTPSQETGDADASLNPLIDGITSNVEKDSGKLNLIESALVHRDIPALVKLGTSNGGFINNDLRSAACTLTLQDPQNRMSKSLRSVIIPG